MVIPGGALGNATSAGPATNWAVRWRRHARLCAIVLRKHGLPSATMRLAGAPEPPARATANRGATPRTRRRLTGVGSTTMPEPGVSLHAGIVPGPTSPPTSAAAIDPTPKYGA